MKYYQITIGGMAFGVAFDAVSQIINISTTGTWTSALIGGLMALALKLDGDRQ